MVNQNPCGDCWAISVATCLSDKFSLATNLPNPRLDATSILSCCCAGDKTTKGCGCNLNYSDENANFKTTCCISGGNRCNGGPQIGAAWSAATVGITTTGCWTAEPEDCAQGVACDTRPTAWHDSKTPSITNPIAAVPACTYPLSKYKCKNGKSVQANDKNGIGVYYAESNTKSQYCRWKDGDKCKGVNIIADPHIVNKVYPIDAQKRLITNLKSEIALYGPVPSSYMVMADSIAAFKGSPNLCNWDNTNGIYFPFYKTEQNGNWKPSYSIQTEFH